MTGRPFSPSPDDLPPRPGAPARRRLTIRERVDRELRGALVAAVADLPRRPSDAYDDVARGHTRPAGKLPDRWIEAAEHGAKRERVKSALREAVERAVDLVFDGLADARAA